MRKLALLTIFVFILLLPLASAQWWNTSWNYRKAINITNNNLSHVLVEEFK